MKLSERIKTWPKVDWIKVLFWSLLITIFSLYYAGLLSPIIEFLSSKQFQFKVSGVKLTPFKIIKAFVILIGLLWLSGRISDVFSRLFQKIPHLDYNDRTLIVKFINILLYFISFLITLSVLGFDLTTISIFGGALGIGIGFGLQKIASNFISGIILLFEKTISEGDLVELPGGPSGFIRRTSARYTLVETFDGREIMVPNEDFITARVTNSTYSSKLGRIELKIGVSYESDIHKAKQIILGSAKSHKLCSAKKSPECYLNNFGNTAIEFILHMWLDDVTEGKLDATNDILFEIWEKFKLEGIKIPHAQPDINTKIPTEVKNAAV